MRERTLSITPHANYGKQQLNNSDYATLLSAHTWSLKWHLAQIKTMISDSAKQHYPLIRGGGRKKKESAQLHMMEV